MKQTIARILVVAAVCAGGFTVAGTASAQPIRDANGNMGCTALVWDSAAGKWVNKDYMHNDEYTDEVGTKRKCKNGTWEVVQGPPRGPKGPRGPLPTHNEWVVT